MSKPPFIIPNRKGTELWPQTGQIPTVSRITAVGEGMTADEVVLARNKAERIVEQKAGQIKQFFLRQRMASDIGVISFVTNATKIMDGLFVRYVRNGSLEQLYVEVQANAFIAALKRETQPLPNSVDIMWIMDTTGSSSSGTVLQFGFNQIYPTLHKLVSENAGLAFRFGVASQGDYPIEPFGGEGDLPYYLNVPLRDGYAGWWLRPNAGSDEPEAQFDAIQQCAVDPAVGWRAAVKIIVGSTDAPVHEGSPHTTFDQMCAVLKSRRIFAYLLNSYDQHADNDVFSGLEVFKPNAMYDVLMEKIRTQLPLAGNAQKL